jgi:hypothetical protein
MRTIIILLFFTLTYNQVSAKNENKSLRLLELPSPNDSLILSYLTSINLDLFVGKPIDSILSRIPFPIQEIIYTRSLKCKFIKVHVCYSDKIDLTIWVKDFYFINPVNCTGSYDFLQVKKETLHMVSIVSNYITIKTDSYGN